MRSLAWALFIFTSLAATSGREPSERVVNVSTAAELVSALETPLDDVTVHLAAGRYLLPGFKQRLELGPCNGYVTHDPTAIGLMVSGRRVRLVGSGADATVIASDAYFRICFRDCADCEIEHVTITGNDVDHTAAALLVTQSQVRIANCIISDNATSSSRPASGVWGWKDAVLTIEFNEISHNSSGICLRENTSGLVRNNLIEGFGALDKIGNEAISLLCDAKATVEQNHIRGLTSGIHLADAASLSLKNNIIEDVYYYGVSTGITDPLHKIGRVRIEQNVIYDCGTAAIAVHADGDQKATRNIIVATGRMKPQASAIMAYGANAEAAIKKNTLYDNTVTDPELDRDVSREAFWRARRPWTRTYRNTAVGVDGRHKFYESAFLTRYGRWAD